MGIILALAIIGTLVSTLIIGYALYYFEVLGVFELSSDALVALLFSSLISAVDPVATLAVFSEIQVDRVLYAIVFGESVLNDAVSISLYQTFLGFVVSEGVFGFVDLLKALGIFLGKFTGALIVGVLIAGFASFLLKHMKMKEPTLAIVFITMTGYIVYSLCEGLKLSGIVGILFCANTLKHYGYYNIESDEGKQSCVDFLHTGAHLAEGVIYLYLGMAFFIVEHEWNWAFIGLSIFLCLFARACHVFILCALANCKREVKISPKFQFMIWFSGLRGAIAFALVLLLPDIPHKNLLVTSTLVIVVVTTLGIGGSTIYVLDALNIKIGDTETPEEKMLNKKLKNAESARNSMKNRFHSLDKNLLLPMLSSKSLYEEPADNENLKQEVIDEDFVKVTESGSIQELNYLRD